MIDLDKIVALRLECKIFTSDGKAYGLCAPLEGESDEAVDFFLRHLFRSIREKIEEFRHD